MSDERKQYHQTPANEPLARKLKIAAWIVTVLVLGLVGAMRQIPKPDLPEGVSFHMLPLLHAILNSLVAVFLVLAILAVKKGKITLHRNFINVALTLSVLFLLSYVTYHITTPETIFGDSNKDGTLSETEKTEIGSKRTAYLVVLLSHIALAAISFPFILFTWIRGFTHQGKAHVSMAKWVFPLWLYVAVTGPVCYLMLRPFYQ